MNDVTPVSADLGRNDWQAAELHRTGPGTPGGKFMRRFWMPVHRKIMEREFRAIAEARPAKEWKAASARVLPTLGF